MGGRWEGVAPAGVLALMCAVSALLLTVAPPRAELVEVDGISLDSHAAAELSNGGGSGQRAGSSALSMHLSHMSSKSINKLLKDNEKGEIDGISLDSRAMAELNGGAPGRGAHASHDSHAARKSKASSRAQRLLDGDGPRRRRDDAAGASQHVVVARAPVGGGGVDPVRLRARRAAATTPPAAGATRTACAPSTRSARCTL